MKTYKIQDLELIHAELNEDFFKSDGLDHKQPLWDFQKKKFVSCDDVLDFLKEFNCDNATIIYNRFKNVNRK